MLTLCRSCMAMTKTIDMECGKCHRIKEIPKGAWTTLCCHKDIHQTDEEISIEDVQEMGYWGVWESELEAYIEIIKRYLDEFYLYQADRKDSGFFEYCFDDIEYCLKKIKELTK